MTNFSPGESLTKSIHYWWIIVILMILGSIGGDIIFRLNPPIYEATAQLEISIDFTRTGRLTELERDQAILTVIYHINSKQVLDEVAARADAEDIHFETGKFIELTANERKSNIWFLRVRHQNPSSAARLADIWAEVSIQRLDTLFPHALLAESQQRYLDSLTGCLEQMVPISPAYNTCGNETMESLQEKISQIGAIIYQEKKSSGGIIPGIIYQPGDPASVPVKPIQNQHGTLLLAGMMIGFLIGIGVVLSLIHISEPTRPY